MFRVWAGTVLDNRTLQEVMLVNDEKDTRTHKIFRALEEACHTFDLAVPIWLDKNIADFKRTSRVRFTQDSFIEKIPFDYLELQLVEEDS